MKNLFKTLIPYKWTALLIILLLLGQAFCDMNLPQYTQSMIDVGIQNRGIEHILPREMLMDEYEELYNESSDTQKALLEEFYYAPSDARNHAIIKEEITDKQLEEADEIMLPTVVARYKELNKNADTENLDKVNEKIETTGENKTVSLDDISEDAENETLLAMGYAYAADCDEAAGVDVDAIQNRYMWKCGVMMLIMAFLMLVCTFAVSFLSARVGAGIGRDLRSKLFRNVISFSTQEIDSFHTSSLITRATNDIQQVQMTSTMLLRMMLYSPCVCIWGLIKVYQTHAHMNFIIVIGTLGLLTIIGGLLVVVTPKFKIMQSLVDGLNSVSREILTGIQVIRAFGQEKTEEKRFDDANSSLYKNQLFTSRMMTLLTPIMMIVMYGITIWIMWVGADRIDTGTIQVGALTAFVSYSTMIVSSFLMIAGMFLFLPRAGVAADRIYEVINTETTIKNEANAKAINQDVQGLVKFDKVSFRYPDAEKNVLEDITFEAKPGETTAIIGSTGCGKTTLVDLIPRFYDVSEGSITIDGVDVKKLTLESLRNIIGYVPQKGMLFSGTIESNIRFGNMEASDEELAEAARIACASEFIDDKEEKYDSEISQGGSNVSGGQRQRLSIARALAKKPKILIFDDSFSALDMKTDAELRKNLAKQASDATKIIVAQRVGTILHSEQIIVLDEGRIVGKGTHEELIKNCDIYREIAESQLSEKELYG